MNLINENNYSFEMKNKVEPFLQSIVKDDFFKSFDGKNIHYEAYVNKNAVANLIIVHGFTESAEKFRELSYYFYNEGYSVFAFDLRGHGKSYKISDKIESVYEDDFNNYAEDINTFIKKIIKPLINSKPIYIYSHSLGANATLLYLEKYKDDVKKAVVSSPMICGNMGMPISLAAFVSKIVCALGGKSIGAPGKCAFNKDLPFEESDATSRERYKYYLDKRIIDDDLKTSGPCFSWVSASLNAKDLILNNTAFLEANIYLIKPEKDKQVLEKYQDLFIKKCKNVKVDKINGTKHEIFFSENSVLSIYLDKIFKFYNER